MSTLAVENVRSSAVPEADADQVMIGRSATAAGPGAAAIVGEPSLLLDALAVARLLGISGRTIRRLDEQGKLPRPIRLGRGVRWRRAELVAWVEGGCPAREEWFWDPRRGKDGRR